MVLQAVTDSISNSIDSFISTPQVKKQPIPQKTRTEVWLKEIGDKFYGNCRACKMKLSVFEFACGHVTSEAKGGLTEVENLRVVCKSCNSKMGVQNMDEFIRERYSATETVPRVISETVPPTVLEDLQVPRESEKVPPAVTQQESNLPDVSELKISENLYIKL